MQIVVCDKDRASLENVTNCLENWIKANHHEDVVMIRLFTSSEDLLNEWDSGMLIDILFTDVRIPDDIEGIQVARIIFRENEHILFVFYSSDMDYAPEGYKVNALRFLRKPVTQENINECMDIAWRQWELRHHQSVAIESGRRLLFLPSDSIICIESYGHNLRLSTTDLKETYEVRANMEKIMKSLPEKLYVRCHRSYIINMMYVRKYEKNTLTLSNGMLIPVGRKYAQAVAASLRQYEPETGTAP